MFISKSIFFKHKLSFVFKSSTIFSPNVQNVEFDFFILERERVREFFLEGESKEANEVRVYCVSNLHTANSNLLKK